MWGGECRRHQDGAYIVFYPVNTTGPVPVLQRYQRLPDEPKSLWKNSSCENNHVYLTAMPGVFRQCSFLQWMWSFRIFYFGYPRVSRLKSTAWSLGIDSFFRGVCFLFCAAAACIVPLLLHFTSAVSTMVKSSLEYFISFTIWPAASPNKTCRHQMQFQSARLLHCNRTWAVYISARPGPVSLRSSSWS